MKFKKGVKIFGARPEILIAMQVIETAMLGTGHELVITSVTDGKHSRGSLHYTGQALDFRSRDMTEDEREEVLRLLNLYLTDEFDVVLEKTHFHVEFQPKG